jgi:hypothetical protein
MAIEWDKIINKNKYSECQLITALNAYYMLTGKYIEQDSDRYEELVDLVGARHGSAIKIKDAWDELGLVVLKEFNSLFDFTTGDRKKPFPLPLEWSVWHKRYGFHSTLIISYEPKTDAVMVTNFDKVTTSFGWMFREDMYMYEQACGKKPIFRLFGLKDENENNKE